MHPPTVSVSMSAQGEPSSAPLLPENTRQERPRNLLYAHRNSEFPDRTPPPPPPIVIPSIVRPRPTVGALLHSGERSTANSKKKTFSPAAKFRGLGCTAAASQQVTVPAVIKDSADWERRKAKKKLKKGFLNGRNKNHGVADGSNFGCNSGVSCVVAEDAWCAPLIGFPAADAERAAVASRRNGAAGRGNGDGDNLDQRERPFLRRSINPDNFCYLNSESDHPPSASNQLRSGVFGPNLRINHRHVRHPSPDSLSEIMILHGGVLMSGRHDRYRGWRLDIDNMTYEQLLELEDRIGYVNTGLKDKEISCCINKINLANIKDLQNHFSIKPDGKCSICQEEYEEGDELGKLKCGHGYHLECIKQWLEQKNVCPVCKTEAAART